MSAAQQNNIEALAEYKAAGVDLSFSNAVGQTPLHVTVLWGNVEATTFLIENGVDVNKQNGPEIGRRTPLHSLVLSNKPVEGRAECAKLLLDAGADMMVAD